MVKNRPAKAGNVRDAALTPLSARSPEKGMAADSSVLAWRISDSDVNVLRKLFWKTYVQVYVHVCVFMWQFYQSGSY